jgi:precorrin 3B synthase CobZ
MALPSTVDVLVVGSGNAGYSAAVSAAQHGAQRILLIDRCPEQWAGGNSYFTAGAYRTVHGGLSDLLPIVNNVDEVMAKKIDLNPHTEDNFANDMRRVCMGRSDAALSKALIQDSNSAIKCLAANGVRFQLSFNRQAYQVDGRFKFWGGLCLKTEDGGKSLIEDHMTIAKRHGIRIVWNTALTGIAPERDGTGVRVRVHQQGRDATIKASALILAGGGFEANPKLRCQYLGPNWDMALVRGTPYNTGECLEIAVRDIAASPAGNWSGCHSVAWDANADPDTGDRIASNEYTKSGYPLGLMLNVEGVRFVDEGFDLRNFTYAKFGRQILNQPDCIAFQVWDSRTAPWLRSEEYRPERVERIEAPTIEELAAKCEQRGLQDCDAFVATIQQYNRAVYAHREQHPDAVWNPAIRDGLSTQSSSLKLPIAKSNWALPLDQGPFLAVKVSCGITFTFGGLAVDPETTQVKSSVTGSSIPGVFCVGEMMGGLFYSNYPGGSGLTSRAVFGRRAGKAAAECAQASGRPQARL